MQVSINLSGKSFYANYLIVSALTYDDLSYNNFSSN